MLLTEIDGCGPKAAASLSENDYVLAEQVAYAPIFETVDIPNVNHSLIENAQLLVTQRSGLSAEKAIENRNYWCNHCDKNVGFGDSSFNSETACLTHHKRCDGCNPTYEF